MPNKSILERFDITKFFLFGKSKHQVPGTVQYIGSKRKENQELLAAARKKVKKILERQKDRRARANYAYLKDEIRDEIGQFLYTKTERRPMILPVIIQV